MARRLVTLSKTLLDSTLWRQTRDVTIPKWSHSETRTRIDYPCGHFNTRYRRTMCFKNRLIIRLRTLV